MNNEMNTKNLNKVYFFHQDNGHVIKNCHALKKEIEGLIVRGYL
jgi:hypothetical protein